MNKFPKTKKWFGRTLTMNKFGNLRTWSTTHHESHHLNITFDPVLGWTCGATCGLYFHSAGYFTTEKSARANVARQLHHARRRINQLFEDTSA